jgi:hypothetical protein
VPLTDEQIISWARPPSETESEKCLSAISQASDALRAKFGNSITIIQQGSHRNRTNIRIDSDVDLAVVHNNFNFSSTSALSPADKALYEANWVPASYSFAHFKTDVQSILATKFGETSVQRKNKCVRVLGNTNRVNADIVPAYEFHRMRTHDQIEAKGIAFMTDQDIRIDSFPEQHYANGVAKNDATGRAFKSCVRVLKHVRNRLIDLGTINKDLMSSHFLECLVWNAPNSCFTEKTYRDDAIAVTTKVWNDMRDNKWNDYAEVSDLKWLFRGGQRNPADAEIFMLEAWRQLQP